MSPLPSSSRGKHQVEVVANVLVEVGHQVVVVAEVDVGLVVVVVVSVDVVVNVQHERDHGGHETHVAAITILHHMPYDYDKSKLPESVAATRYSVTFQVFTLPRLLLELIHGLGGDGFGSLVSSVDILITVHGVKEALREMFQLS